LNLDPTQVRKDLESIQAVGKPRVGFSVPQLIEAIETFLGYKETNQAFLAGIGSLGTALLGYNRFSEFGLKIVAAFDIDSRRIGTRVHGIEIQPLAWLPDLAKQMSVHLGIVTVPASAAQSVADLMVRSGIKAIWNFAPVSLRLSKEVIVQDEDLYKSLAVLSYKLAVRLHDTPGDAVSTTDEASRVNKIETE
jgi:redox-sensing transcriptional repressor